MTKFNTVGEAKKSLQDNGFHYTQWNKERGGPVTSAQPLNHETHLEDYAKIAVFLCSQADFDTAMGAVSKKLWQQYILFNADTTNKFTRALGVVARAARFDFQSRFQLHTDGGPSKPPIGIMLIEGDAQLGYMLRNKLFWKDSMDSRHGEHTHSLQWLAIHEGAGTATPAAELYSYCADYRLQSADDRSSERSFTVWQWLADCFSSDMKKAAEGSAFKNGEKLLTDSARSPQVIMDRLMLGDPVAKKNHFVSTYLYARYKKRSWLVEVEVFDQEKQAKVKSVTDLQNRSIKPARQDVLDSGKWVASPSSPDARMLRNTAHQASAPASEKKSYKMKFHEIEGRLYEG
jgi:hypothetical protein